MKINVYINEDQMVCGPELYLIWPRGIYSTEQVWSGGEKKREIEKERRTKKTERDEMVIYLVKEFSNYQKSGKRTHTPWWGDVINWESLKRAGTTWWKCDRLGIMQKSKHTLMGRFDRLESCKRASTPWWEIWSTGNRAKEQATP